MPDLISFTVNDSGSVKTNRMLVALAAKKGSHDETSPVSLTQ
jgi:phosphoribosyl-dephospho-CoA transferase